MQGLREEVAGHREANYDIDPMFLNRWSPRAMKAESFDEEDLMPLLEAARWAPSSYNNQHWRFVYTMHDDEEFEDMEELMAEGNQAWAKNAGALIVLVSKKTFDHNDEPARTHSFDCGAAWENLALEGARRELAVHAMQGFDYEAAAEWLDLPEPFEVECMIAVGNRAEPSTLEEDYREREEPSGRKPIEEIASRGAFDF